MSRVAQGSNKDYCSSYPAETHHMISHSTGAADVPWVERCNLCGWIDGEALQRYADNAKKRTLTERAQRIAIASDLQPFAFVEVADHKTPLTMDEILMQALGAASMCWRGATTDGIDTARAKSIYAALKREVDRALEAEREG